MLLRLKLLDSYLHINGFIHRDVKAANLLIDDDGTVLLGDLGVAADLSEDSSPYRVPSTGQTDSQVLDNNDTKRTVAFDSSSHRMSRPRMGKRKSFVGTVRLFYSLLKEYMLNVIF